MKAFIANFGRENHLWRDCLERSTIATLEGEDVRPLRLAGDREEYIRLTVATRRTARGILPTRQVASRWFNLVGIVENTESDLWIHREKDSLWWTISRTGDPDVVLQQAYPGDLERARVCVTHKPADQWQNTSRSGNRLTWSALHPKAQEFLFTESTLQQLSEENAAYALALIAGDDLQRWHSQPTWRAKEEKAGRSAGFVLNARQLTIARMVATARETVKRADGLPIVRNTKLKECKFRNLLEFEAYVTELFEAQDGLCAITAIPLQLDGVDEDAEFRCSLDRIDSNLHYEPGNLQIVCAFVNRWKNDDSDHNFRRLISFLRESA